MVHPFGWGHQVYLCWPVSNTVITPQRLPIPVFFRAAAIEQVQDDMITKTVELASLSKR